MWFCAKNEEFVAKIYTSVTKFSLAIFALTERLPTSATLVIFNIQSEKHKDTKDKVLGNHEGIIAELGKYIMIKSQKNIMWNIRCRIVSFSNHICILQSFWATIKIWGVFPKLLVQSPMNTREHFALTSINVKSKICGRKWSLWR